MMRVILSLLLVWLVVGCAPKTDDLQQFVLEAKQNAQPHIEPYPEFSPTPPFVYSAAELPSPFVNMAEKGEQMVALTQADCLQPDVKAPKQALQRYGVDAMEFQGVYSLGDTQWALIMTNDGRLHKAKKGDRLGLFFGRIVDISNNQIRFQELVPDGTGCWQHKTSSISMSRGAGE